jgi:hypothetical protein
MSGDEETELGGHSTLGAVGSLPFDTSRARQARMYDYALAKCEL